MTVTDKNVQDALAACTKPEFKDLRVIPERMGEGGSVGLLVGVGVGTPLGGIGEIITGPVGTAVGAVIGAGEGVYEIVTGKNETPDPECVGKTIQAITNGGHNQQTAPQPQYGLPQQASPYQYYPPRQRYDPYGR